MAKRVDIEKRYPRLIEQLGQQPDSHLAVQYGITSTRVYQLRKERDVPVFKKPIEHVGPGRKESKPKSLPTFRNLLLRELRKIWLAEGDERRSKDLAEELGVASRRLSDLASGSVGRQPGMDMLIRLAAMVDRQLIIDQLGVVIRKRAVIASKYDIHIPRGPGETFS